MNGSNGTARGWAEISDCGTWRYALRRTWADGPVLGWLMLNPSTADAVLNDQTIHQVMHFSRRDGYGGAWVANLYAFRSPSPAVLHELVRSDPERAIGPDSNNWIAEMLLTVPAVVAAWGSHGGKQWALPRKAAVLDAARSAGIPVLCLGTTAAGEPRHPCRLARVTPLEALS